MALRTHTQAAALRLSVVVFIVLLLCMFTIAYNLDTELYIYKKGPPNSFFGYSIAFHQMKAENKPEEYM